MDNDHKRMDCEQAAASILLAADGDLEPNERGLVETHLQECAWCREQQALFRNADERLLACRDALDVLSPALSDARARLVGKLTAPQDRNWVRWLRTVRAWQWASVALAVLGAVAVVTWPGNTSPPRELATGTTELIPIELPLSPVGDPFFDGSSAEAPILADLVVGSDGQPESIRLAN